MKQVTKTVCVWLRGDDSEIPTDAIKELDAAITADSGYYYGGLHLTNAQDFLRFISCHEELFQKILGTTLSHES